MNKVHRMQKIVFQTDPDHLWHDHLLVETFHDIHQFDMNNMLEPSCCNFIFCFVFKTIEKKIYMRKSNDAFNITSINHINGTLF